MDQPVQELCTAVLDTLRTYIGAQLKGVLLFGGLVEQDNERRYRDADLLVVVTSLTSDLMSQAEAAIGDLHSNSDTARVYLAHPPIIAGLGDSHIMNAFLARLVTDYGVTWFGTKELHSFLRTLAATATDPEVTHAASILATDSLFFMQQYSLPHGDFLDPFRLKLYFAHHMFRWMQTTIWRTDRELCATKEHVLEHLKSLLPELHIQPVAVGAIYDFLSSPSNRINAFLQCRHSHKLQWG